MVNKLLAQRSNRHRLEVNPNLAAAFGASYQTLAPAQRELLRRVERTESGTDAPAVAELLHTDLAEAERRLRDLVDRELLIRVAPGRYQLHDQFLAAGIVTSS
jgi:hypothetical protein